jgi:hypothetical protein
MVAWLRGHPYLDAVNKPVDVAVGGVAGKQFDVQIPTMPEIYPSDVCEKACLPLFVDDPGGAPITVFTGGYRIIVLNVASQPVVIVISGKYFPDKRALAKVEEVLKTIEWK